MNRRDFMKLTGLAGLSLAGAVQAGSTPMKILLWCWDSRMTWDDQPDAILTRMAAAEKKFPYPKRPEAFQTGFRRLVDYCAECGIWGVIVWGFLRDAHGGVAAAADLCKYAADKGVAILPGVGLCSYGGYYFDGDHEFNLDTYLRNHPDRASTAVEDGGGRDHVSPVLDPALEANQKWWRDGLEWMLDTFEIGGIDYEMGDFIVNPSPAAVAARDALGFQADGNVMDVVVATRGLMRRAVELRPRGVFINCTYRGFHQVKNLNAAPYAKALPPETVWEYTLTGMVRRPEFPGGYGNVRPHRMYGYLHWFNASTKTEQKDFTEDIASLFPGLRRLGFEFAGTYGEISPLTSPAADPNYRAQVEQARNAPQA